MIKKMLLMIAASLVLTAPGWCVEALHADPEGKRMTIGAHSEILLDPSGRLAISDLLSPDNDRLFKPLAAQKFSFSLTDNVLWIRFKIKRSKPDAASDALILSIDKQFPFVDLYLPPSGRLSGPYTIIRSGYLIKNHDSSLNYRYAAFKLPGDLPENRFVYIRIQPFSDHSHDSLVFSASIEGWNSFVLKTWRDIAFFFLIFGVLCSMLLYNLFLSFILKDRPYYIYIGYVTFILLYFWLRSGMGSIAGLSGSTAFIVPTVAISFAFGIGFSQAFLNTRQYCPVLDKLMWGLIAGALVVVSAMFAGMTIFGNTLMHLLAFIGPFLPISAGTKRLAQGYSPARYYLAAWILVAIGTLIIGMLGFAIIPRNFLTTNALAVGSAFEVILLSMALGDRIRLLREETRALQKKERRLMALSVTDELTGLFNKRWFSSKLGNEIKTCRQSGQPLSLMVIDVDHFKRFNDTYGHATGDKVLQQLGKIIASSVREHDAACRYGGEEFTVILPLTGLAKAVQVAQRLRQNFAAAVFSADSGETMRATISIGVSDLVDDDDDRQLFEKADKALYAAKTGGRNRVVTAA